MTAGPRVFRIPLRMRFRGVESREGVLLPGPAGWGEFSPFAEYPPSVTALWLAAASEAAEGRWPTPRRTEIPVNTTVPSVGPEAAYALVAASGCATAKVKVADPDGCPADDVARVEAVRDALGKDGKLRVDANGGWDVDTAVRMIAELGRFDLEYVEQPVAMLHELGAVRRRVGVPIAADESVRHLVARGSPSGGPLAGDPLSREAARQLAAAADLVVLKVQPLGGVHAALAVADMVGLPVVVSSAVETSVGLAAGVALAAALPDLPYACGLGTAALLVGDVVADPLLPAEGRVPVRRVTVDEQALQRWELSGPPAEAWRQRAADAAAAGVSS